MKKDIYGMVPGQFYFCQVFDTVGKPMLKRVNIEQALSKGQTNAFGDYEIKRKDPASDLTLGNKDLFPHGAFTKLKTPNCSICRWILWSELTEGTTALCTAQGFAPCNISWNSDQCQQLFCQQIFDIEEPTTSAGLTYYDIAENVLKNFGKDGHVSDIDKIDKNLTLEECAKLAEKYPVSYSDIKKLFWRGKR